MRVDTTTTDPLMCLDMGHINPVSVLRGFVGAYDSQRAAAKALKITPSYLNDLLNGRRTFSRPMLVKLGLRQTWVKSTNGKKGS